ncbi:hypothetical protein SERLA73DRAFT_47713 [Serpula lacrymans var. lacrymans S7.3]|uniref:Uncharacterized protein n=1 Tax=Serpula lacrymans var. lacrymans (strain S7.3) TaxID=936435 RepID=F8PM46_SERL3|nr:hypothetical protein SERLA73DRAFT_47713 [Serpula lacrymans var. lacrymans S7.3]
MIKATSASIAYAATQVRFALTFLPVFMKSDTVTDSESFYNSILNLFDDLDKIEEVLELLIWWNQYIF